MYDSILRIIGRAIIPFIMMYGLYVIIFGHESPGGGFSGGATFATGFILYRLTFMGVEDTPELKRGFGITRLGYLIEERGMLMQAVTGLYTFFIGIIFLLIIFPNPLFVVHGNWFNAANGFKVALSLVKLFYLLNEEEDESGAISHSK